MSEQHIFDETSMSQDCSCGWRTEGDRSSVASARSAWQQHFKARTRPISCFDPVVPPAMQRASEVPRSEPSIGQFNVVGDELRKLNEKMDRLIYRQGLMEEAANSRYTTTAQLIGKVELIQQNQQLIMQKLESLRAEVACKCVVIAKFRGGYAQDPSKCPVHCYPALEIARQRQPKPVRRKGSKR